jgi:hypothetical protein
MHFRAAHRATDARHAQRLYTSAARRKNASARILLCTTRTNRWPPCHAEAESGTRSAKRQPDALVVHQSATAAASGASYHPAAQLAQQGCLYSASRSGGGCEGPPPGAAAHSPVQAALPAAPLIIWPLLPIAPQKLLSKGSKDVEQRTGGAQRGSLRRWPGRPCAAGKGRNPVPHLHLATSVFCLSQYHTRRLPRR